MPRKVDRSGELLARLETTVRELGDHVRTLEGDLADANARLALYEAPAAEPTEPAAPPPARSADPGAAKELDVVVSGVASFADLVEVERHLAAIPAVRAAFVRDFRNGTATLAVRLLERLGAEELAQRASDERGSGLALDSVGPRRVELHVVNAGMR